MSTRDSLEKSHQRALRLLAKQEGLISEHRDLSKNVQFAIDKLLYKPEIDAFMETLQMRVHQKSVGKFEKLLTSIVNDVFPGIGRVSIDIENKRQAASLSISIMNGDYPEDPYSGRGGSIANVLSLGLRFIALTGGGFRKFIVLDEPDCWLKPDRIPSFVNVISSLSREMGIQVLMVSHHNESYFEKNASLVNLKVDKTELRAGKKIKSLCLGELSGQPFEWGDEQKGIRSVRLKNFMSYSDLTIPLSPGFTVLTGDNDIGKSGSVVALRALIRDEWKESFIRHTENAALIELDLGPEGTILSARSRTGSKKTFHAHLKDTGEAPFGPDAPKWLIEMGFNNEQCAIRQDESKTPAWISKLGFDVNPMDVQIGIQKQPVFLLDKPGTQQAAVLSMGVSNHFYHLLSAVQSVYKTDFKKLADIKRDGEKRIEDIKKQLNILAPICEIEKSAAIAKNKFDSLTHDRVDIQASQNIVDQLVSLSPLANKKPIAIQHTAHAYKDTASIESLIYQLSDLNKFVTAKPIAIQENPILINSIDVKELNSILGALTDGSRFKGVKPIAINSTHYVVHNPSEIFAVGSPLNNLKKFVNIKPIKVNPVYKELTETPQTILDDLKVIIAEKTALKEKLLDISNENIQIDLNLKAYQDEIGDACLSCGQAIDHTHDHDSDIELEHRM